MPAPLQITSRHFEPSPTLNQAIADEFARLEQLCDRIVRCHVTVEQPNVHKSHGAHFVVKIDFVVPNGELFVGRDPADRFTHDDPYVAVSDAFRIARRRLNDHLARLRGDVKRHAAV